MWPAIRLVISLHTGLKCRADVHHDRGPALPNQNAKCSHASRKSPQISRGLWLAQQAPRASHMIEHVQFDTPNLQGEHLQFRRLDLRVLLNSVPPAAAIVMIADDATGGNRESPL